MFNDISLLGSKMVFLVPRIRPLVYLKKKNQHKIASKKGCKRERKNGENLRGRKEGWRNGVKEKRKARGS